MPNLMNETENVSMSVKSEQSSTFTKPGKHHIIKTTEDEETKFIQTGDTNRKETNPKPISRTTITFLSSIFLAFMVGYSYNSFNLVKDVSLLKYSFDFFPEYHEIFRNLPPVFFFLGSGISTSILIFRKSYNMKKSLFFCSFILAISYVIDAAYPHILIVFLVRIITGLAVGPIMIFIPQILHEIAPQKRKGIASSLYTFGYLLGITCPLTLIPLVNSDYYLFPKLLPIFLSLFCFILLLHTVALGKKAKTENPVSIFSFMFESATIKTFFSIAALQFFQKITGAQFVALFSTEFFTGENKYINSITPLLIAICFNFIGGMVPEYIGRKFPVVAGLAGISLIMFTIYFSEVSLWLIISFIFLYNSGLSVVPYVYQQEIVKPAFKNIANEISTMLYSIFSILMVLCIAFVYTKSSKSIYLIFAVGSLVGSILLSIIMIETLRKPSYDFITGWLNYSSWFKHKI